MIMYVVSAEFANAAETVNVHYTKNSMAAAVVELLRDHATKIVITQHEEKILTLEEACQVGAEYGHGQDVSKTMWNSSEGRASTFLAMCVNELEG